MVRSHENILDDPLNGCPKDFANDFAPVEMKKARTLQSRSSRMLLACEALL